VFQSGVPLRSTPPSAVDSKLPACESFQATGSICVSAVQALGDCGRWLRRTAKAVHPQQHGVGLCTICLTGGFYSEFTEHVQR